MVCTVTLVLALVGVVVVGTQLAYGTNELAYDPDHSHKAPAGPSTMEAALWLGGGGGGPYIVGLGRFRHMDKESA